MPLIFDQKTDDTGVVDFATRVATVARQYSLDGRWCATYKQALSEMGVDTLIASQDEVLADVLVPVRIKVPGLVPVDLRDKTLEEIQQIVTEKVGVIQPRNGDGTSSESLRLFRNATRNQFSGARFYSVGEPLVMDVNVVSTEMKTAEHVRPIEDGFYDRGFTVRRRDYLAPHAVVFNATDEDHGLHILPSVRQASVNQGDWVAGCNTARRLGSTGWATPDFDALPDDTTCCQGCITYMTGRFREGEAPLGPGVDHFHEVEVKNTDEDEVDPEEIRRGIIDKVFKAVKSVL